MHDLVDGRRWLQRGRDACRDGVLQGIQIIGLGGQSAGLADRAAEIHRGGDRGDGLQGRLLLGRGGDEGAVDRGICKARIDACVPPEGEKAFGRSDFRVEHVHGSRTGIVLDHRHVTFG